MRMAVLLLAAGRDLRGGVGQAQPLRRAILDRRRSLRHPRDRRQRGRAVRCRRGKDESLLADRFPAGTFDLALTWDADLRRGQGVSLFTAVEEQLGLKLEARRGLVDVLVIDRAEPPAEN